MHPKKSGQSFQPDEMNTLNEKEEDDVDRKCLLLLLLQFIIVQ